MRTLVRNRRPFQYRNFVGETDKKIGDDYTGVLVPSYSLPISCKGVIGLATGQSNTEIFGELEGYDKVITIYEDLPITETSVINIENVISTADAPYDYVVKRVAKSLNYTSIAIAKVKRT